ncbi:MAG: flagellar motor switch protein [Methanomassiliicoccales archaeon PtaU1.Bin124]|nr:MAG: flagellar motor switch protein [Methanomassiliicoccales archaeon PtaU1.Bin124]
MNLESAERLPLDELQVDALKELGNVGASHASTALSNLVKKEIAIAVTYCHLDPFKELPLRFAKPGDTIVIVRIDVNAQEGGEILMVFSEAIATWLSDQVFGKEHVARRLQEGDPDALVEIGDICIREYLNPISRFLKMDLMPSPPNVSVEQVPIGNLPASLAMLNSTNAAVIETEFADGLKSFNGFIMFLPRKDVQALTFKKFGVDADSQAEMFAKFGVM